MKSIKCRLGFHVPCAVTVRTYSSASISDLHDKSSDEIKALPNEIKQFTKTKCPDMLLPIFVCERCGDLMKRETVLLLKLYVKEQWKVGVNVFGKDSSGRPKLFCPIANGVSIAVRVAGTWIHILSCKYRIHFI